MLQRRSCMCTYVPPPVTTRCTSHLFVFCRCRFPAAGKTTTVRAFCEWSFNRAGLPLRWEGEGVNEVRSAAATRILYNSCQCSLAGTMPVLLHAYLIQ
jgi:hypothetical protein